jgi:hypothetical protein
MMPERSGFGQLGFTATWFPLKKYTGWTSKIVVQSSPESFDMWKLPTICILMVWALLSSWRLVDTEPEFPTSLRAAVPPVR